MKVADVPLKFVLPFGQNSASGDIRTIPVTTTDPTAASLSAGFPPDTFTPIPSGGSPPNGADFQGLFNQDTAWARWVAAGGPIKYDAAFAADANVGGYPKGAIIQSATTFGVFWYCTVDDNLTDPDASGAGWLGFTLTPVPGTGAYLRYVTGTQIILAPANGGKLWINGLNYVVPAGLTLPNTGLAPSTLYYCYAYINAGAMALELSTTGFVMGSNGMPQKAADPTRTFVGLVQTQGLTPGQFQIQGVGVLSYFNRVNLNLFTPIQGGASTSSTSVVQLGAITLKLLSFGDEAMLASMTGIGQINPASNTFSVGIGVDGIAPVKGGQTMGGISAVASIANFPMNVPFYETLALGSHELTMLGQVNAGSASGAIANTYILANVRG